MPEDEESAEPVSPYRPGYNRRPPVLAGREDVLAAADEALTLAARDALMPPALVIYGQRGVGKSVLLSEIAQRAASRYGWPRLHVEVTPNVAFTPAVVAGIDDLLAQFDEPARPGLHVKQAVIGAGVPGVHGEVTFGQENKPSGDAAVDLRRAVTKAVDVAITRAGGFVFTLDEMQLAKRDELAQLTALLQRGTDLDWPVVVVCAGLVSMRDPDRAVTYFERADWHEIGILTRAETLQALQVPAEAAGRPLDEDAAALLAEASGGYPYAIQLYGHHAWGASSGQPRITYRAAQKALLIAGRRLEQGLYASRWAQASPGEQDYLAALATVLQARPSVRGADVAVQLGVTTRQVGTVRDRLIKKGIIVADGERLSFELPGMAEYVRRQRERAQLTPGFAPGDAPNSTRDHSPGAPFEPGGRAVFEPRWPRRRDQDGPDLGL